VLLPWEPGRDCATLAPDLADAVFGIPPSPEEASERPRLGVTLAPAGHGVRGSEGTAGRNAPAGAAPRGAGFRRGAAAPPARPRGGAPATCVRWSTPRPRAPGFRSPCGAAAAP